MALYEFNVDGHQWAVDLGSFGKQTITIDGKVVSYQRLFFSITSKHRFKTEYKDLPQRAVVSIYKDWFLVVIKCKINGKLIFKESIKKTGVAGWLAGGKLLILVLPLLIRPPLYPFDWMSIPFMAGIIIILYTMGYLLISGIRFGFCLLIGKDISDILYIKKLAFLMLASSVLLLGMYKARLDREDIDDYGKQLAEEIQVTCVTELVCPEIPLGWVKDEKENRRYLRKKVGYMWLMYKTNFDNNDFILRVYHSFDHELIFKGGVLAELDQTERS